MRLNQNRLGMLWSRDCITTPRWKCPRYWFTGLFSMMLPFSVELLMSCESCALAWPWHTLPRGGREHWAQHCPLFSHSCHVLASVEGLLLLRLKRRCYQVLSKLIFFLNFGCMTLAGSQNDDTAHFAVQLNSAVTAVSKLVFIFLRVKAFNSRLIKEAQIKHISEEVVEKDLN